MCVCVCGARHHTVDEPGGVVYKAADENTSTDGAGEGANQAAPGVDCQVPTPRSLRMLAVEITDYELAR